MNKKDTSLKVYYNKTRNNWFVPIPIKNTQTNQIKVHKKYFKTKEEAIEEIKQLEYKRGNAIFIQNNGIPINKIMEFINERKLKNGQEEIGQYGKTNDLIKRITSLGIGNKDISDITVSDLEDFFSTLVNYQKSYIDQWISQFTQAFKYAQKHKLIDLNPMDDVCKPKSTKQKRKVRSLEIEEQKILTNYLTDKSILEEHYKNAFLIQTYMGLRIGEVLGLKRNDIDFKEGIIHIKRTIKKDDKGRFYLGDTTKTPAGVRDVPIPKIINKYVKEQFINSINNDNNLLFVNSNGKLSNPRTVNTVLKRIVLQTLSVTDITTHCLRHTFGTRCIEAGIPAVVVQRLMGHESIEITLNTYVDVLNKFKNKELKKLNYFYNINNVFKNDSPKYDYDMDL